MHLKKNRRMRADVFLRMILSANVTMHIFLLTTLFKVLNQKVVKIIYYFQRLKIERTMKNTYIRKKYSSALFNSVISFVDIDFSV